MGTESIRDDENIYEDMVGILSAELIRENFELLSDAGSSREVYALNVEFIKENFELPSAALDALDNSIVVKLSKNEYGQEQNQTEYEVYQQVLKYQNMTESAILSDIHGIYEGDIRPEERRVNIARSLENILAAVYAISSNGEILLMERLVESCDNSADLEDHSIMLLIKRFSLHPDDIESEDSWMYDEDDDSKLVDYGCTKELVKRMDWRGDYEDPQDEDE
ncbi:hypothetical protein COJ48_19580 [Bacillus cereus]|nr:hypothetical protein COJ48_19580 [Bacillus cereus]PGP88967.1 hypothetical protein CN997_01505 [Bacillus cereus]